MGRPQESIDCCDIQRYIHQKNVVCSRNLLDALKASHPELAPEEVRPDPVEPEPAERGPAQIVVGAQHLQCAIAARVPKIHGEIGIGRKIERHGKGRRGAITNVGDARGLACEPEPAEPEPLPPIPNAEIAAAAEIAFPSWVGAMKRIQRAVCDEYGVTLVDLCSQRRNQRVVRPRQIAMYLCRTLTNRSLPEIGRRFGGRDHTTALYAIRRIETICASDEAFRARVERVAEQVGGAVA